MGKFLTWICPLNAIPWAITSYEFSPKMYFYSPFITFNFLIYNQTYIWWSSKCIATGIIRDRQCRWATESVEALFRHGITKATFTHITLGKPYHISLQTMTVFDPRPVRLRYALNREPMKAGFTTKTSAFACHYHCTNFPYSHFIRL